MFRVKWVLFWVVLFGGFLFGGDNLKYFETKVYFKEKNFGLPKYTDKYVMLNARFILKDTNNKDTINLHIIPCFKNDICECFSYYHKNEHYYHTVRNYIENIPPNKNTYPYMTIKILNISEEDFQLLEQQLFHKDNVITKFLSQDINIPHRIELQDKRFSTNKGFQFGSLCERVLEKKQLYFLEQLPNYKDYQIEISVKDLCHNGSERLKGYCVGDDFKLLIDKGEIKSLEEQKTSTIVEDETPYSYKFEKNTNTNLMNPYKIFLDEQERVEIETVGQTLKTDKELNTAITISVPNKDYEIEVKIDNDIISLAKKTLVRYTIDKSDRKKLQNLITINGKEKGKLYFNEDEILDCETDNDNISCEFTDNRKIRLFKTFTTDNRNICKIYLKQIDIKYDSDLNIYLTDIDKLKDKTISYGDKTYIIELNIEKKEISIKKEECQKIPLDINNLNEFKYDGTYYLYFYNSEEACKNDIDNTKGLFAIDEGFENDVNGQKICKNYQWIKGENFTRCIKAKSNDKKLKFEIKDSKIKRLIIVENNDYFFRVNGLKDKIKKQIKKDMDDKSSQLIILESNGRYKIGNERLNAFNCQGKEKNFSPFKSLNSLNELIEKNKKLEDIIYFTAKRNLNESHTDITNILLWQLNGIKLHIRSTKANCKIWKKKNHSIQTVCTEF